MPSIGSYLQPAIDTGIQMKDYAHASRLYLDDTFALAPKSGWIYYVVFDIDPSTISDTQWATQQRVSEVGMLVKAVDLPKFTHQTEVVNQYNRKTVINKGIVYNPINLTLHDDNSNVTHNMWLNYYRYYYADSVVGAGAIGTGQGNVTSAFQNNKYTPSTDVYNPVNYGLNSDKVVAPFFRSITIYQMSRTYFTSYQLVNPIIQQWEHDRLDQSNGARMAESRMTVAYEAVLYGNGRVSKDNPSGFAMFHYDTSPSPLSLAGGGNSSIFGPGGIMAGAVDLYGDVTNLASASPIGVLGTALKAASLAKNVKGVSKNSLRAEAYAIVNKELRSFAQGALNGLGVNINLNKGNSYTTSGQFLGTPVSVVTASAVGQEVANSGVTTQGQTAKPAGSFDPQSKSISLVGAISAVADAVLGTSFSKNSTDNSPSGSTVASGNYFPTTQSFTNTTPYTTAITQTSSISDIQASLNALNTSWNTDLDWYNSNSVSPDTIQAKLNDSANSEEFSAVKSEAQAVLSAQSTTLDQINNKYAYEQARLSELLASKQTPSVAGNKTLQTTPDSKSSSSS